MERFNICSRIIATCLSPHPISRDLSHTGHLLIIIHWPELRYLRPPLGMISLINHDSPLSHQPLAPVVCHARAWSQTTAKSVGSSVEVKRRSHKALIGNFDLESSFWHPYLTTTINIYIYLDLQKFHNICTFGLLHVWAVLTVPRQNWTFQNKIEQAFPHHVIIPLNLG